MHVSNADVSVDAGVVDKVIPLLMAPGSAPCTVKQANHRETRKV